MSRVVLKGRERRFDTVYIVYCICLTRSAIDCGLYLLFFSVTDNRNTNSIQL